MQFQNNTAACIKDLPEQPPDLDLPSAPAFLDALTGLPNYTLFRNQLDLCLSRAEHKSQNMALVIIGLDRFKQVNDTYGYAAGDLVLQASSRRLAKFQAESCALARLGGDTFALAVGNSDNGQAITALAEQIKQSLSTPFLIEGEEAFITVSIGISHYPSQGKTVCELIANAKTAMDQIKDHGRDSHLFFDPEHHQSRRSTRRALLEQALHHALKKEQLILHYQPQIDLDSGEMRGVEALLRWEHPELGTISPAEFIPLAEEIGLIHPISEWVLHRACAQNSAWHKQGHNDLRMAVNLSAQQFSKPGLDRLVHEALAESGLAPRWLELELTETIALHDIDAAIETLKILKNMGVRLAIDDFGTGYSSLTYLRHFPIHSIKIDRSFIGGITTNSSDAAITRGVIAMAQNLGVRVVAEGVENEKQLIFLRSYQCHEVQGYYFFPPMPAKNIGHILLRQRETAAPSTCWSSQIPLEFPAGNL
ncbi:MAG: bifunctional diguanylate cyclase/phosphodiesterase [Sulfuricella denitrificans]|nr:bifunctional diguanylate cyclase/phosphodiesterase [Sulfuricella denitrificans]